jgi:cell division protein FtsL
MSAIPKQIPSRTVRRTPPSPSRRPSPASRPDPPPRRARRRPLAFFVFSSLVVGGIVLALTAFNAVLAQSSFRIHDLSTRVQELSQTYERMQLEEARLSSPGRIAKAARKLGMVLPEQVEVIHVRIPQQDPASHPRDGGSARSLALKAVVGGIG